MIFEKSFKIKNSFVLKMGGVYSAMTSKVWRLARMLTDLGRVHGSGRTELVCVRPPQ
jgi:hypothetical protein